MRLFLALGLLTSLLETTLPGARAEDGAPRVLRLEENIAYGEMIVVGEAENVHRA